MAFLAILCSVCLSTNRQKEKPSNNDTSNTSCRAQPYQGHDQMNHAPFEPFISEDDPFHSSQPLPRYTERPMSIREKTLAFSGRRSMTDDPAPRDEKNRDVTQQQHSQPQPQQSPPPPPTANSTSDDDASSTFSLPSSFGNTSTATGETPPPPYSIISSRAPSQRSMSISISTHETGPAYDDPFANDSFSLTQPPAALRRGRDSRSIRRASITQRPRPSVESRRRTPSLPPTYSRP